MKEFIPYCQEADQEKIKRWTKLGDKTFDADVVKKNFGLMDILQVLPSLQLKTEFILQKFPTIMPRYYTIASSSLVYPTDLAMAISLSEWSMPDGSKRRGLASAFLDDLMRSGQSAKVRAFIKPSHFVMPQNPETPIIMVGPGTGVVPFIGFMQERCKMRDDLGKTLG